MLVMLANKKAFKEVVLMNSVEQDWPALPFEEWEATYRTLHMWTQIVGKIRLMLTPLVNHFWNVALYVNERGLTTSPIPIGDALLRFSSTLSITVWRS